MCCCSHAGLLCWKEAGGPNARRPHCRCGLLEDILTFKRSASSSDMARPGIVDRATTESSAGDCPVVVHGGIHTDEPRLVSIGISSTARTPRCSEILLNHAGTGIAFFRWVKK